MEPNLPNSRQVTENERNFAGIGHHHMQQEQSRLGDRAFGAGAERLITIKYRAQLDALTFLLNELREQNNVALIHGPEYSGKSTLMRLLGPLLPRDMSIALVDGLRIKPRQLLSDALAQFGHDAELESTDELLQTLNAFAAQQTRANEPPVLIIDNADRMFPSALKTLDTLSSMKSQGRYVLRILLTGRSERMPGISGRGIAAFEIQPMTISETTNYLHTRLTACGVTHPDTVLPLDTCDQIHEQCEGWPGRANLSAIQSMSPQPPSLVISRDGEVLEEYRFRDKKVLIGRSDFADIIIKDDFVSKMHVVLVLYSDALVLIDLNSINGTTVNSRKLKSTVLQSDDVISLGNHRIKVLNAPPVSADMAKTLREHDTVQMQNLADLRRAKTRRSDLTAVEN